MDIAIIANQSVQEGDLLKKQLKDCKRIVAVDGGLLTCQALDIHPDFFIGDLDSCPAELLNQYPDLEKEIHLPDKDLTDLELALEHEMDPNKEIAIFCAMGGRADHSYANLLILSRYPKQVTFYSDFERIFIIEDFTQLDCFKGQHLSLLPINGSAEGITTTGLKWELNEAKMDQYFFGISNQCEKAKVTVAVRKGQLLCSLIERRS